MVDLFNLEPDDPLNYGMLAAASQLLTPVSRGGGLGPAFGSFGATVSREKQNKIDNELKKQLIESRRRDAKDPYSNMPSDVRSAMAYMHGTPEYKAAYDIVTKQAKIFDVAGIKYTRGPNGEVVQLTPTQEAALNAEILARAKEFGKQDEQSRFKLNPITGPDGKLTFGTDEQILRGQGAFPMAPRLPNALQQPSMPAPGIPPRPSVMDLAARERMRGISGYNTTPVSADQFPPHDPPMSQPGMRPPAVGQAALDVGKAAAIDANKSAQQVADERAERDRGFKELERIFDQAETLLPFATGSGLGEWRDKAFGFVGHSTDASKAASALAGLQAQAMRYVPRFKGQDSDRDVATYRQAIGVLGDRSQPNDDRKAAIQTIRRLIAKAKDQGADVGGDEPTKPDNDPLGLRRR